MKKIGKIILTAALAGSLLFGNALAYAAPGGNGKSFVESEQQVKANKSKDKAAGAKVLKEKAKTKEAKKFMDTEKHWAKGPVERLQLLGIVSGFPDGGFHPEEQVTEAQVIAMVMGVDELLEDPATTEDPSVVSSTYGDELNDVPDWAKGVVGKAKKKGIVNMNRFHSNVQANRVQSMVWVAKSMGLEPADASNLPFKDGILVSPEDIGYVMALYNEGLVKGGPGGILNPNSSITRAEIAAIIDRMLNEAEGTTDTTNTTDTADSTDGTTETQQ